MTASRFHGKGVFFLATETATQEMVEKGLAVGGKHAPFELLGELGTQVVLSSIPTCLQTLGRVIALVTPVPQGCWDPSPHHVHSFRH